MHLLAAAAAPRDDTVAIDLAQQPADIVMLSAADSDLACLVAARRRLPADFPSLALANLLRLGHPMSIDLYDDAVLRHAKLVIVRLLGGIPYWPYGVERLTARARAGELHLALLPGDARPDPDLAAASSLPGETLTRLGSYALEGGIDNAEQLLRYAANLIGGALPWREPAALPRAGMWAATLTGGPPDRPTVPIVFYRALLQAGNTEPIEALADALRARGLAPLPVFVSSLKEPEAAALIGDVIARTAPAVILNTTGFAIGRFGASGDDLLSLADCPVLQVVLAGGDRASWVDGTRGLAPRDIAMQVALPEVDGRILARAVSFKRQAERDPLTQADLARHQPEPSRVGFVADLAHAWAGLRTTPPPARRVGLILANYPNRDGRIGNGVGLDTPESAARLLAALAAAGYAAPDAPPDGAALMARLLAGPTNARRLAARSTDVAWPLADYKSFFATLPSTVRNAVEARWGAPERDPFVVDGGFAMPGFVAGNLAVLIQPARGYNVDPQASYHDPDLVPPHFYFACYGWLRRGFGAHAVIHLGKHGNLEWLPGKALALSEDCYPEAALGPLPHLYPFIVNDPGEGTQAKRRTSAVIIDHLTPTLTRAESYGPLRDLERLVDEYYEASALDPRRLPHLSKAILEQAATAGLAEDCGIRTDDAVPAALTKLDGFLCDLKELQIRDGLHVFGSTPEGGLLTDLLVALVRTPRGNGAGDESLLRALARDLDLGFDPLATDFAAPWTGPRPACLAAGDPWRSCGDTVERLEGLAARLIAGTVAVDPAWHATRAVLAMVDARLRPAVEACGPAEHANLLRGLDGRFVAPGPSGAPTRGRPDVLPTGRNFYSVDTRALPTAAAWHLGFRSAQLLVERYAQEHGRWPRHLALSTWGTSTMRTGGDDVAQALALMGVRPTWDGASQRVSGFEILPAALLDRPRVDVTLRVSGFFRDAFPGLIDLVDRAARAVAALDEPVEINPQAARVAAATSALVGHGLAPARARRLASFRVFGSQPGAYGAGLQALIDEGGWGDARDLAEAYLVWGCYAYGSDGDGGSAEGLAARDRFESLLGTVDAVVHNQDNREHDLLDSDDYYQFEGGLAAAVTALSGSRPPVYHNDHSRPEQPRIRRLEEEIARVVRARAVNPKWLAGVRRHGYKGAAEIAATVDYLFAFAATTGAVRDHHFDAIYQAYVEDPAVAGFIAAANPAALAELAARLDEAIRRGLWRPRSNQAGERLTRLIAGEAA
ncbi:MAG: cobaltochelatase subunit CobN [Proteobacteria bacterium]|nr:cobaltochelatase subunit CobN [Pseudomonadota bacterium]